MPDCSKRPSRHSSSSRSTRSASRPCSQTGSRCTDRQNFCCLSSGEIEGRITRLQQKMRQYNRELRDKVAEISSGDGPMDMVLMTVVEMTTKYELPFEEITGMVNGVTNEIVNGMANGRADGVANEVVNGMANGILNGVANGEIVGIANDLVNGVAEDIDNEIANEMANGIGIGMMNGGIYGIANDGINGTADGLDNAAANNGVANGILNGIINGVGDRPMNGMVNGNYILNIDDQDLSALIASALNRFRDEMSPNEERPRF